MIRKIDHNAILRPENQILRIIERMRQDSEKAKRT